MCLHCTILVSYLYFYVEKIYKHFNIFKPLTTFFKKITHISILFLRQVSLIL